MMTTADAIEKSRSYLSSSEALQSIERDPYWPKWSSPWWVYCMDSRGISDWVSEKYFKETGKTVVLLVTGFA